MTDNTGHWGAAMSTETTERPPSAENRRTVLWVIITLAWLVFSAYLFMLLLSHLQTRLTNEDLFARGLASIAWPFVAFALAAPVALILISNMGNLLKLSSSLHSAPDKIQKTVGNLDGALTRVEDIRKLVSDLDTRSTNVQNTYIEISDKLDILLQRLKSVRQQAGEDRLPRVRFDEHYDVATDLFYESLSHYNEKHPDNPQTVNRGGGNRRTITGALQQAKMFAANIEDNSSIANYLIKTFVADMASRKKEPDPKMIDELDALKKKIPEKYFRSDGS
jgi:hypothetical protein